MADQKPSAEASTRDLLLQRLDTIIAMVEAGSYDPARQALFVGKWTQEYDAEDLPGDVLREAISHTDAAHNSLSRWPPDTEGAKADLLAARKLLG